MKGTGKKVLPVLAIAALMETAPAYAMIPVIDLPNLFMNKLNFVMLLKIKDELHNNKAGTVNNNTYITAENTTNIATWTSTINTTTQHIDESTTNISNITQLNYDIDTSFTWIINNDGDEIIPIPDPVGKKLEKILNWKDPGKFTAQFKASSEYGSLPEGGYAQDATIDGSRARKAANDTLIQAVGSEQDAFVGELAALNLLAKKNKTVTGHAHQLQVANALAGSEVNQLMKLRSMMLVAEASRAVDAQVAADKDARAIAVGSHLRGGLESAVSQSLMPKSTH